MLRVVFLFAIFAMVASATVAILGKRVRQEGADPSNGSKHAKPSAAHRRMPFDPATLVRVRRVNELFGREISMVAREKGIDPRLVLAVVATEVGGKTTREAMINAIGKSGEIGLMQVKPLTASQYRITAPELFQPITNLRTGTKYLRELQDSNGSTILALLSYNEGPTGARGLILGGLRPTEHSYIKKVRVYANILGLEIK